MEQPPDQRPHTRNRPGQTFTVTQQVGTSETPVYTTDEGTCTTNPTTPKGTTMLPILAITDTTDAEILFDVLNDAAVRETDDERRQRLNMLLIATHAELIRLRNK